MRSMVVTMWWVTALSYAELLAEGQPNRCWRLSAGRAGPEVRHGHVQKTWSCGASIPRWGQPGHTQGMSGMPDLARQAGLLKAPVRRCMWAPEVKATLRAVCARALS
jgi:hypothetical protein